MPALQWEKTAPDVERASRVVPGYGTLVMLIRYLGAQTFLTGIVLPEPEGHEPEIIQQLRDDVSQEEYCESLKIFFQEFIDRIEINMGRQAPVLTPAVIPPYLILKSGQSIMCLSCGMESHSPDDVRHRFCGHCKRYAPERSQGYHEQ